MRGEEDESLLTEEEESLLDDGGLKKKAIDRTKNSVLKFHRYTRTGMHHTQTHTYTHGIKIKCIGAERMNNGGDN